MNLYERVAKRKAKIQRPFLLKFLQEIGYDDIFNVDEVNEIKKIYDKAQEDMKEAFEQEQNAAALVAKLEDKMLAEAKPAKDEAPVASDQLLTVKISQTAHYGMVTGLHYSDSARMLTTVSDDTQVNLWSVGDEKSEPIFMLRGHKAPVYCVTGAAQNDRLIFTAGAESLIKIWMLPVFGTFDRYPKTEGRSFCVGEWGAAIENPSSDEAYVSLKYAPFGEMLLAAKHGGMIEIWDCKEQLKKASEFK